MCLTPDYKMSDFCDYGGNLLILRASACSSVNREATPASLPHKEEESAL